MRYTLRMYPFRLKYSLFKQNFYSYYNKTITLQNGFPKTNNIYSGTIGYIEPNGNFDFNVVIRTILYDSISKVLNIPVVAPAA